jgi:hypothetical protein
MTTLAKKETTTARARTKEVLDFRYKRHDLVALAETRQLPQTVKTRADHSF